MLLEQLSLQINGCESTTSRADELALLAVGASVGLGAMLRVGLLNEIALPTLCSLIAACIREAVAGAQATASDDRMQIAASPPAEVRRHGRGCGCG